MYFLVITTVGSLFVSGGVARAQDLPCETAASTWSCPTQFQDVSSGSLYQPYILNACNAKLVPPCAPGFFCPGELVARDDAAFSLEKGLGRRGDHALRDGVGNVFGDVRPGYCLGGVVEQAVADKLMDLCDSSAGLFCPGAQLKRGDAAKVLARAMEYPLPDASIPVSGAGYSCTSGGFSHYVDVTPTSTYCRHVHFLWAKQVIGAALGGCSGSCTGNCFCPGNVMRRDLWAAAVSTAFPALTHASIAGISPSQYTANTPVTISTAPATFQPVQAVFGGVVAQVVSTNQNVITVTPPSLADGVVDVGVLGADGGFAVAQNAFQYGSGGSLGSFGMISPASGQTVSASPTFQWSRSDQARYYNVYVWAAGAQQPTTANVQVAAPATSVVYPATLVYGQTYKWLVTAAASSGSGATQLAASNAAGGWTISIGSQPARFHLQTPDNGQQFFPVGEVATEPNIVLAWDVSQNAQNYDVYVTNLQSPQRDLPATSVQLVSVAPGTYSWYVVAKNGTLTQASDENPRTFTALSTYADASGKVTLADPVTGNDTGVGLAGVELAADTNFSSYFPVAFATTGADGTFVFHQLRRNMLYYVHPYGTSSAYQYRAICQSCNPASAVQTVQPPGSALNFTARPLTATISGRVTLLGSGLAGVTVNLTQVGGTIPYTGSATTGADGSFNFSGRLPGTYVVEPQATSAVGYTFAPGSKSVDLAGVARTGVDFAANPHTVAGTVRITSLVNGNRIAGVVPNLQMTLSAAGGQGPCVGSGGVGVPCTLLTSGAGVFVFTGLRNGAYTLSAPASQYWFGGPKAVTLPDPASFPGDPVISFAADLYTIAGTVSGLTSEAATVHWANNLASGDVTVGADGAFSIRGPAATYTLTPLAAGRCFAPPSLVIVASADTAGVVFAAQAKPAVKGTVTLGGAGIAGATVRLLNSANQQPVATTSSLAGGLYQFDSVAAGSYTLDASFTPGSGLPANEASPASIGPFTVCAADVTGQNFSIVTHSISGTVTLDGYGIQNLLVRVRDGSTVLGSVQTGQDGTYTIPGLLDRSNLTLEVVQEGYCPDPASRVVSVGPDQTGVNFTVEEATGLGGRVSHPVARHGDNSFFGAVVTCRDITNGLPGSDCGSYTTDTGGYYGVTGSGGPQAIPGPPVIGHLYQLTPSARGYTFTPAFRTVTYQCATPSQDFVADH